jgi:8-oxo-dGTP diphosphatase
LGEGAIYVEIALKYTLCFIKRNQQMLLLSRNYSPNMGLWNGLGGKIESGETPYENVLREVWEEAGIKLPDVRFRGILTWTSEQGSGGLYLFLAELPADFSYPTPRKTDEGILEWKDLTWILDSNNLGIVSNIPRFLEKVAGDAESCQYHCTYDSGKLVHFAVLPLPPEYSMFDGKKERVDAR